MHGKPPVILAENEDMVVRRVNCVKSTQFESRSHRSRLGGACMRRLTQVSSVENLYFAPVDIRGTLHRGDVHVGD